MAQAEELYAKVAAMEEALVTLVKLIENSSPPTPGQSAGRLRVIATELMRDQLETTREIGRAMAGLADRLG